MAEGRGFCCHVCRFNRCCQRCCLRLRPCLPCGVWPGRSYCQTRRNRAPATPLPARNAWWSVNGKYTPERLRVHVHGLTQVHRMREAGYRDSPISGQQDSMRRGPVPRLALPTVLASEGPRNISSRTPQSPSSPGPGSKRGCRACLRRCSPLPDSPGAAPRQTRR